MRNRRVLPLFGIAITLLGTAAVPAVGAGNAIGAPPTAPKGAPAADPKVIERARMPAQAASSMIERIGVKAAADASATAPEPPPPPPLSQDWFSGLAGTGTGDARAARCEPSEHLAGLDVRIGDAITALSPICAQARPDGSRDRLWASEGFGGAGGESRQLVCPDSSPFVRMLKGRVESGSSQVSGLFIVCWGLMEPIQPTSVASHTGRVLFVGGQGHTSAPPSLLTEPLGYLNCPDGKAPVGVHGRAAAVVGALGLMCGSVVTAAAMDTTSAQSTGPVASQASDPWADIPPQPMPQQQTASLPTEQMDAIPQPLSQSQQGAQPAYTPYEGPATYSSPQYLVPAPSSQRSSMRELFAAGLAGAVASSGATVITGIAQGLTGAIIGWFTRDRNSNRRPAAAVGNSAAEQKMAGVAAASAPYVEGTSYSPASASPLPLSAGIAFEVHALDASGYGTPIDPATHVFRTGDRFRVFYRPSLPGRVDVWNINQRGQKAQIDTLQVAAGELANLGPYEFSDDPGEESLILQLSPCSSDVLLAATRDIVKVQENLDARPALQLAECTNPGAGAVRQKTRNIRKVAMEGGTGFALDELTTQEIASGQVAPRQVTLRFTHQ